MSHGTEEETDLPTGDELVRILAALSNPHRLRIMAVLAGGTLHVSELARTVGLSRPLVHMHLQRLEAAGLVSGHLELGEEGRALKLFEVRAFALELTPDAIADAVRTLTAQTKEELE